MSALFLILILSLVLMVTSFHGKLPTSIRLSSRVASMSVYSLDQSSLEKLEELSEKYTRLSNVVSPESDAEKSKIEDVVKKYNLYKDIKAMMTRLRLMWKSEVSERRKEKQLNSFKQLYKGKVELEEILKEKLGLPFSKAAPEITPLKELERIDQEIGALQQKVEKVKFTLPEGKSTREARFN